MPDAPIGYKPPKKSRNKEVETIIIPEHIIAAETKKIDAMKGSAGYDEYMLEQEKTKQSIANMKQQGENEKFMNELNQYLKKNKK